MKKTLQEAVKESIEKFKKNNVKSVNNVECYVGDSKVLLTIENKGKENECQECGKTLETEEEIKFGECDECCAWKYRENSK